MSRIKFALLFFSLLLPLSANEWLGDLAQAKAVAVREGKPVYLDLYAEWCGFCRKLFNEEYPRAEFQEPIKDFVTVRLDGEKHPEVMHAFGIRGFPTAIIFDPKGQEVERIQGYKPAEQIAQVLRSVVRRYVKKDAAPAPAVDPKGLLGHYKAATYYFEQNQFDLARQHYLKAFLEPEKGLETERRLALYNAAVSAMKMQDYVYAISYWHVYVAVYPQAEDFAEARYFRSRCYRYMGMQSEAQPDLVYAAKHLKSAVERAQALGELQRL